jgi:hypothetical protein
MALRGNFCALSLCRSGSWIDGHGTARRRRHGRRGPRARRLRRFTIDVGSSASPVPAKARVVLLMMGPRGPGRKTLVRRAARRRKGDGPNGPVSGVWPVSCVWLVGVGGCTACRSGTATHRHFCYGTTATHRAKLSRTLRAAHREQARSTGPQRRARYNGHLSGLTCFLATTQK